MGITFLLVLVDSDSVVLMPFISHFTAYLGYRLYYILISHTLGVRLCFVFVCCSVCLFVSQPSDAVIRPIL